MIVLAFRLAWAFARLLLQLASAAGTLAGFALLTVARWVDARWAARQSTRLVRR